MLIMSWTCARPRSRSARPSRGCGSDMYRVVTALCPTCRPETERTGRPPNRVTSGVNVPETQGGQTVGVDRQEEFVLRTLEERDVRFVRLWFTDVLGYLKSVAVAPAELEGAFAEGIRVDGSGVAGFAQVS